MSATLVARDLSAGHGAKALFDDLDLVVAPGDVIGLLGPNGAGKSTLLRTLAGELDPEAGDVVLAPASATVGYLPQEHERRVGETVAGFLERRTGVAAATARYEAASAGLADGTTEADNEYAEAFERWLALGAADFEDRAEVAMKDVGLTVPLDTAMTALSGGQAARAGLASLLLSRYDLYLLDEPTNDLDLAGLELLEQFVSSLRAGTIIVSHDREFLSRTVTSVLELDSHQHQISFYDGGYDAYLHEREIARQHAREEYDEYAGKVSDLRNRMTTQRNWATQGVRNARRKQATERDKFVKNFAADSAEKQAAKVRQSERAIERLERNAVEEPRKEWELRMEIAAAPRSGAVSAALTDAVVRRGDFALGPLSLEIGWAEKVAITGPNGAGKSTLLGALLGRLPLDSGEAYLGPGVVVGEVDQARRRFEQTSSILDAFSAHAPTLAPEDIRTLLAKYGLKSDHVTRPTQTLSPGERTRAGLALLQASGVNLLVLDEPTNHLDLPAIEQLEQALATYPGTLLLVTHDRRMLEAVRTTRHLQVDAGRVSES
ncbi:ABC-F family ATP-binding cassette domain-containing protein [Nocardioides baekrokdamisoli]|uniref:ABC-F family ATP-binding cassette domain-containing protein n=1 Tax=Nocardioides baekrokdamisoli TaxID=1804624 RepID=UPI000F7A618E|nr:ABC-F family ATP-binding cassette domain-containing protein [Nocardioides baekrokdamisoli]